MIGNSVNGLRSSRRGFTSHLSFGAIALLAAVSIALAFLFVAAPARAVFGVASFSVTPSTTQAGAHPNLDIYVERSGRATEDLKDLTIDLPAGLLANPEAALTKCTDSQFNADACPAASEVGSLAVTFTGGDARVNTTGNVYVLEPGPVDAMTLGFIVRPAGARRIFFKNRGVNAVKVRTDGDYGVSNTILDIPRTLIPENSSRINDITIDTLAIRMYSRAGSGQTGPYFMVNPTRCDNAAPSKLRAVDYNGAVVTATAGFTPTGCLAAPGPVPFSGATSVAMSPSTAGSPAAPSFTLTLPTDDAVIQNSHLRSVSVTFPYGSGLNFEELSSIPALCSSSELQADMCPAGSRMGSVTADVPFLPPALTGDIFLIARGTQIRFGFILRGARGVTAAIEGNASTIDADSDGADDSVVARFLNLPEVPFRSVNLTFSRPVLLNPLACGPTTSTKMTGYSGAAVTSTATYALDQCGGPILVITSPTESQTVGGTSVDVSFIAGADTEYAVCQLDDGTLDTACPTTKNFPVLTEGSHNVTVVAVGPNRAATAVVRGFKVDRTPPTVAISSPAQGASVSTSSIDVAFTTSHDAVSTTCALDGGIAAECTSPQRYDRLSDGSHTVSVTASDRAANKVTATSGFTVNAPPVVTIESPSAGQTLTTSDVPVVFTVSGQVSVTCQLDAGAIDTACVSPKTYTGVANGAHSITVSATDADGKVSSAVAGFTVKGGLWVDVTSPTEGQALNSSSVTLTYDSNDAVSATCKLDSGKALNCESPSNYTGLADGTHAITLVVKNSAGSSAQATRNFTVDTVAPAVNVTSPTEDAVVASAAVGVSFTVGTGAVSVTCQLDSGAVDSACVTPKSYTEVASGSHQMKVTAKDAAGNATAVVRNFSTDILPPGVFVTEPRQDEVLTSSTVQLSFTTTTDTATTSCQLDSGTVNAACGAPTTYVGVGEGRHTATVTATDLAGNSYTTSTWWWVDTTPPSLTITSPADGALITASTVEISFTTSSDAAAKTCQLDAGTIDTNCASPKTYTNVTDGAHAVTVTAKDSRGNVATAYVGFTVDTSPPSVTITAPAAGAVLTSSTVDLVFTVSADTVSTTCQLDAGTVASGCTSPKSYTGVVAGSHVLTVTVADAVGNKVTAIRNFSVSGSSGLALSVSSPAEGSTIADTAVSVQYSVTGASGTVAVSCQMDTGTVDAACVSPKSYSGLTDGAHKVTVIAKDGTGSTATVARNFTVDTTPPTLAISNPTESQLVNTTEVSLQFTVSSDAVTVTCQLDAGAIESACTSPKSYTGVADGIHKATVKAADAGGNTATAVRGFTVDATAPTLTVDSPFNGQTVTSSTVNVVFAVGSDAVKVTCQLDTGAEDSACVSPKTYSSVGSGSHSLKITATDAAGNVATYSGKFSVDTSSRFAIPKFSVTMSDTQAGGHPDLTLYLDRSGNSDDDIKDLIIDLPEGVLANASAIAPCSRTDFGNDRCPGTSQVGTVHVTGVALGLTIPIPGSVYLVTPGSADAATLGFVLRPPLINLLLGNVYITDMITVRKTKVGLHNSVLNVPDNLAGIPITVEDLKLVLQSRAGADKKGPYFVVNPTSCKPALSTIKAISHDNVVATNSSQYTPTGCSTVPFATSGSASVSPTTGGAPSLLTYGIQTSWTDATVQNSHLRDVTIDFPTGTGINFPEIGAIGDLCTDDQLLADRCPAASAIGSVSALVPYLVPPDFAGTAHLMDRGLTPKIGLTISGARGVFTTATGTFATVDRNGDTIDDGVVARFRDLPEVPIADLTIALSRPLITNPNSCNATSIITTFAGWSGAASTVSSPVTFTDCDTTPPTLTVASPTEGATLTSSTVNVSFTVGSDSVATTCQLDAGAVDTACVSPKTFTAVSNGSHSVTVTATDAIGNKATVVRSFSVNAGGPFTSALTVVNSTTQAAAHPTLTLTADFTGTSSVKTGTMTMPNGQWGSIAAVSVRCSIADAAAGACPAASKIGTASITGSTASGSITASGDMFMTDPPLSDLSAGVSFKVTNAGLGSLIAQGSVDVVNNATNMAVDFGTIPNMIGTTAITLSSYSLTFDGSVGAATGNPLMTNPSSCAASAYKSKFSAYDGAGSVPPDVPFQATSCSTVPFNPGFNVTFTNPNAGQVTGAIVDVTVPADNSALLLVNAKMPASIGANFPAFGTASDRCPSANASPGTFDPAVCPPQANAGSMTISTPLLPTPAIGSVWLIDKTPLPWFGVDVPVPGANLRLVGTTSTPQVDPACDPSLDVCQTQISATFNGIQDVPLTSVGLNLNKTDRALGLVLNVAAPGECKPTDTALYQLRPHTGTAPATGSKTVAFNGC